MKTTLIILFLFSANVFANAAVDWRTNHLYHLEKMTVGPWDNFGTTVSELKPEIIYTQDKNQILSLFKHNVETGESEKLTLVSGDVKQPALNKTGTMLSFTYFGNDAQGDVCIYRIEKKELDCISSNSGVEQSPFWLNEFQIGYLKRKIDSLAWELVLYDIKTAKHNTIAEGVISAPAASNDGKYILFNDKMGARQILRVYDVSSGLVSIMPEMDLPGNVGFTAFSVTDDFVYFSYYLNDTNTDQRIDADDNSVIFRLPFSKWKSSKQNIFPEQLTSVDYNCKFPKPALTFLYLTCAFEGSLDIYRLPLTGMVSAHWRKPQLEEAHLVSRSYEQRLLLLNAMRYRFNEISVDMLQRIIGNHLQVGEITAARYYIAQLLEYSQKQGVVSQAAVSKSAIKFYQMLDSLLFLRSEKNKHQNDIVTIAFRRLADEVKVKISQIEGRNITKALSSAFIENELGNSEQALKHLDAVSIKNYPLEIQKYLAISLYENLLPPEKRYRLTELYPIMFNDMGMSFEFRLFYAFKYIKAQAGEMTKVIDVSDKKIQALFQVEKFARSILIAKDDKSKVITYRKLSKLIKASRDDILLRKALHVLTIQIFSENNEYKYMELFSRHWLTVSQVREMEFFNVAEQYAKINKDKAYGFMHRNQMAKAFNTFYPVIRQTNDLEAYYQFLTLGMDEKNGQKTTLDKSIALLKKQKLLGENEKYTEALRLLIETAGDSKKYSKALDDALVLLKSTSSNVPAEAMHELLQGFIYHKKMQASQGGYVYDKRLYQNAHYHYMLALDLAQNNGRISATVLQNLGWLHKSVGQYALAVNYFERRAQYPFLNVDSEQSLRWALANTFYFNNQAASAYEQMQLILKMPASSLSASNPLNSVPFQEKAAFYAMQAEKFDVAAKHYADIFSFKTKLSDLNVSKMRLAYGYSLKKAGDRKAAIIQFKQVLTIAGKLSKLPAGEERLVVFNPARQKLIATGFLVELSHTFEDKEKYLLERIAILRSLKGADDIAFDESARLSFLAKDYQNLAMLYERNNKMDKMLVSMNQSIDVGSAWVESSGDSMGPVIFRVLINYLSLGVTHSDLFRNQTHKKLDITYSAMNEAFSEYPYPTPSIIYQRAKSNIIWQAFNAGLISGQKFNGDLIMADENVNGLRKSSVDKYAELEKLVTYFNRKNLGSKK